MVLVTLHFISRIGADQQEFEFQTMGSAVFRSVLELVCQQHGLVLETIGVATTRGTVLTSSDLDLTVEQIITKFEGNTFELVDQGVVG